MKITGKTTNLLRAKYHRTLTMILKYKPRKVSTTADLMIRGKWITAIILQKN